MSLSRIITDWQLDLELMNKESRDILYLRAFSIRNYSRSTYKDCILTRGLEKCNNVIE